MDTEMRHDGIYNDVTRAMYNLYIFRGEKIKINKTKNKIKLEEKWKIQKDQLK